MQASDAVIGGVIVITGTRAWADTAKGKFTMQPVVSGFLLGSFLLLVAMVSPALAKGLVGLGLVGAFVTNGPAVLNTVGKLG